MCKTKEPFRGGIWCMKTTALTSAFVLLQTRFPKIYYDSRGMTLCKVRSGKDRRNFPLELSLICKPA